MKVGVNLKIDVTNIEKARLFQGEKGTYLDAQVFVDVDEKDQYGNNGMITQAVSKDERDQGVKGAILGNCRVFWQGESDKPKQNNPSHMNPDGTPKSPQQMAKPNFDDTDDDIPF